VQLERELRTYRNRLPELVQHAGKYVLIQDGDVIDVFAAYGDALRDGYRRFGPRSVPGQADPDPGARPLLHSFPPRTNADEARGTGTRKLC
jgi:hypothetical protein